MIKQLSLRIVCLSIGIQCAAHPLISAAEDNAPRLLPHVLHSLVGDDAVAFLGWNPNLSIIKSAFPVAFSQEDHQITVTSGLIDEAQSEDEIAFVLAHEIAHQRHGESEASMLGSNYMLEEELRADKFAVELLVQSGRNPEAAISLLERLSQASHAQQLSHAQVQVVLPESTRAALTMRVSKLKTLLHP